ncbi:MAG TPA: hypothetical protein ACQGQF_01895 [Xylella fastidiosa subsp. pauca]
MALQQTPPLKLTTQQHSNTATQQHSNTATQQHQSNDDATQHAHNTIKPETLQGQ